MYGSGLKRSVRRFHGVSAGSNSHSSISPWEQSACGFVAGAVSKLVTMPADVIKKRFQVARFHANARHMQQQPTHSTCTSISTTTPIHFPSPSPPSPPFNSVPERRPFKGVWDCARGIVIHEGWGGLFKVPHISHIRSPAVFCPACPFHSFIHPFHRAQRTLHSSLLLFWLLMWL